MPSSFRSLPATFAPLGAFVGLAVLLMWPLPLHLGTHLSGDPAGDLGVYVWNLWIFSHELLHHGRLPFSTNHVFAYTQGADFSLHNYTPLAGLAGMPLMGVLGVVATFNVVLLLIVAVSGFSLFLLCRKLGLSWVAAFVAGGLFVGAPVVSARATAHLSLLTTAPLPLFLLALLRVLESGRRRDAAVVGLVVALASYSDAYFGVYCVLIGLFTVAWRFTRLDVSTAAGRASQRVRRGADALIALVAGLVAIRLVTGPGTVALGPMRVGMQTLYTPMFALLVLVLVRAWATWPPRLAIRDPERRLPGMVPLGGIAVVTCLALLAPLLIGIGLRVAEGRLPQTEVLWRSSPRGVDLLAYAVPNPLHPWFGNVTSRWLLPDRQDAFPEFIAAFPLVATAAIVVALSIRALPAFWVWFTAAFASLSLGPFVHVLGVNTYLPGPWAFLRYVPVVGMARAPARFSIVAALGLSVLAGYALDAWLRRGGQRARAVAVVAAALLATEMTPVPRALYAADVPNVYRLIASGDESRALLELPTGVRDGTSSMGDFTAATQFYQTRHGRPVVGGYLSRVSPWRKREAQRSPVLSVLMALSEGDQPVDPELLERARTAKGQFLARACVGFVILDKKRASPVLRSTAVDLLGLIRVHDDERFELFRPDSRPPCQPGARRGSRPDSGDGRAAATDGSAR